MHTFKVRCHDYVEIRSCLKQYTNYLCLLELVNIIIISTLSLFVNHGKYFMLLKVQTLLMTNCCGSEASVSNPFSAFYHQPVSLFDHGG